MMILKRFRKLFDVLDDKNASELLGLDKED
jgi:hypothetical protein